MTTFEIYKDRKKEWRWHAKKKGRIVASSAGDGYRRKGRMCRSLTRFMDDLVDGRFRVIELAVALLLVVQGCASAPVRRAQVSPPMPPMPPMPPGLTATAFTPAATGGAFLIVRQFPVRTYIIAGITSTVVPICVTTPIVPARYEVQISTNNMATWTTRFGTTENNPGTNCWYIPLSPKETNRFFLRAVMIP